jgi:hypothetical protein
MKEPSGGAIRLMDTEGFSLSSPSLRALPLASPVLLFAFGRQNRLWL